MISGPASELIAMESSTVRTSGDACGVEHLRRGGDLRAHLFVATPGTLALSCIVLPDSGHLQEEEANFANRQGYSKHSPARVDHSRTRPAM